MNNNCPKIVRILMKKLSQNRQDSDEKIYPKNGTN